MQLTHVALLALVVGCARARLAALTDDMIGEQLYTNVVAGNYDNAVTKSLELESTNRGDVIRQVVNRLITNRKKNIMEYAYSLSGNEEKNQIVEKYFPVQFRLILGGNYIQLIHKGSGGTIVETGSNEREVPELGIQKFIPVWNYNRLYFKIMSAECNTYKYLSRSDHIVYSNDDGSSTNYQWYLEPFVYQSDLMFVIYNRWNSEALEFRDVDDDDSEELCGGSNAVQESPDSYGWFIVPADSAPVAQDCST